MTSFRTNLIATHRRDPGWAGYLVVASLTNIPRSKLCAVMALLGGMTCRNRCCLLSCHCSMVSRLHLRCGTNLDFHMWWIWNHFWMMTWFRGNNSKAWQEWTKCLTAATLRTKVLLATNGTCLCKTKSMFNSWLLQKTKSLSFLTEKEHSVPQPNEAPEVEIPHGTVSWICFPISALPVKESLHLYNFAFSKMKIALVYSY